MKPVNIGEIRKSLWKFVAYFSLLLVFSLLCIFLIVRTFDEEYQLLKERNDEIENMLSSRIEINQQFALINKYFKEMGQYSNSLSDMAKKRILQTNIAKSSSVISNEIAKIESANHRPSIDLYKKMNAEVSNISRLQDSLFSTKNILESKRIQIKACLDENTRIQRDIDNIGIRGRRPRNNN